MLKINVEDIPFENGKYIIKLDKPIEAHGQTLSELRLSEPNLKDVEEAEKVEGENAKMFAILSKLANIPPSSVHSMAVRDFKKNVAPVLVALLGEPQETGEM